VYKIRNLKLLLIFNLILHVKSIMLKNKLDYLWVKLKFNKKNQFCWEGFTTLSYNIIYLDTWCGKMHGSLDYMIYLQRIRINCFLLQKILLTTAKWMKNTFIIFDIDFRTRYIVTKRLTHWTRILTDRGSLVMANWFNDLAFR